MRDIVGSLKTKIGQLILQTSGEISPGLDCLNGLSPDGAKEFHAGLRELQHCVEIRFPVPSTSLDLKCKRNSTTPNQTLQDSGQRQRHDCSVLPVLEFLSFPHNIIIFKTLPSVFHNEMRLEVLKIAGEVLINQKRIRNINQMRRKTISEAAGIDVFSSVSLSDVFSVVDSRKYPLLWKEFTMANRIMATTVCCEQSFNIIKQSTHINMNTETFIRNATNKLQKSSIPKWF